MRTYKWKLTTKSGKAISHHKTKKLAQKAQLASNKAHVYVRKV